MLARLIMIRRKGRRRTGPKVHRTPVDPGTYGQKGELRLQQGHEHMEENRLDQDTYV